MNPGRILRSVVALVVVTVLLQVAPDPAAAQTDPALVAGLDGVVALSPPDTCLRVDLERATVYRHQADVPLIPASTQKLLVGEVALDAMGPDHRYRTSVRGPAPVDGVVAGDLTLVGGGDPLLSTAAYAFVRRAADQPLTFLDALADQIAASGVRHVTGGVVGDETRYDTARSVATWPERYLSQEQIGPLSALTVDDGFRLTLPGPDEGGAPDRVRSAEPATDAAAALTVLLLERGIRVDGAAKTGVAPPGTEELAAVSSAPLSDIVEQLLQESDNGTAELLTKELGHHSGGGGSTEAGTSFIERRAAEMGLPVAGTDLTDGSGLDRGNRATCDQLVALLATAGGVDGALADALPVAGRSGTLRGRFRGTPAEGRLRAKTGSLNGVTALAGFVEMPDGRIATFAYIANGPQAESPLRAQEFLGALLGQYEQVCPDGSAAPLVAPIGVYAVNAAALAPTATAAVLAPSMLVTLQSFEDHPDAVVSSCLADDPGFVLRLPA